MAGTPVWPLQPRGCGGRSRGRPWWCHDGSGSGGSAEGARSGRVAFSPRSQRDDVRL